MINAFTAKSKHLKIGLKKTAVKAEWLIKSENSWYWQSTPIIQTNQALRNILRPLVKE